MQPNSTPTTSLQAYPNMTDQEIPRYSLDERKQDIIIRLNNFRIHGDVKIKIPLNKTTLLKGVSGAGKTSILEAFMFVLYDGIQNPERFNTRKCSGWIFIKDLIIYRSQKEPKLIKVWRNKTINGELRPEIVSEHTGEDAQNVIDKEFGNKEIFLGCSYLRQKEFSVFLQGTDAEKLAIIKAVATKGTEVDDIKLPVKEAVKNIELQFNASKAQLDMAIQSWTKFNSMHPNISQIPNTERPEEVFPKVMALKSEINDLEKKFKETIATETKVDMMKMQNEQLKIKFNGYEQALKATNIPTIQKRIAEINEKLKEFSAAVADVDKISKAKIFQTWSAEKDRLETRIKDVTKDADLNITNIKKVFTDFPAGTTDDFIYISSLKDKIEKAKNDTHANVTILQQIGVNSIQAAQDQIVKLEKNLTDAKDKETRIRAEITKSRLSNKLKCPGCSATLVMSENGKALEKCPDAPMGLGMLLGNDKVDKAVPAIPTVDDLSKAVEETFKLTSQIERLKQGVTASEEKAKQVKLSLGTYDYATAINALTLFNRYESFKEALKQHSTSLEFHMKNKPEEVSAVGVKQPDVNSKTILENELTNLNNAIMQYNWTIREHKDCDEQIKKSSQLMIDELQKIGDNSATIERQKQEKQAHIDRLLRLNSESELINQRSLIQRDVVEKRELALMLEKRLFAAKRLLEKTIEAERIMLQGAIDDINANLARYLKRLFIATPMSVEISSTKELKSKKNAVSQRFDIKITYNNAQYKDVKQLSVGERDRLSLAITLAMNQRFGSALLFLDETLSSLDSESKMEVITLLKEISIDRTIVSVAHDETEGIYDRVLNIRSTA